MTFMIKARGCNLWSWFGQKNAKHVSPWVVVLIIVSLVAFFGVPFGARMGSCAKGVSTSMFTHPFLGDGWF
jgi:hypothetical protein